MDDDINEPTHWNARYAQGNTPWDRGEPALALTELLASMDVAPRTVLVPGAGTGHDAVAWALAGHRVVAVDFSPDALRAARHNAERAGVELECVLADIFALPASLAGRFDIVWEQTCLCAIAPSRRSEYVEAMWKGLAAKGTLYALLWNHGRDGGPPFDLPPAVAKDLFEPRFEVGGETPIPGSSRKREYLLTLRRRD